ncbi:energy-coupling factor ABC transporter substrate-binding protein [Nocardiopsis gilva YIM 90087]|uniref:Cobalt transport protein CbiN n=1 Tax=Nocardiopsis gilva YIM 90087 TaxID=1235441 RepID=A0A223S9Q2_9ACTN|nr:energy-coupling factor ABC transporter substrate-binding protein [Nocardiopsis gilva]ASU84864.1 energy-coupling factor ABC transporter substrate-binding protein [Nocardiopsis gilva YIM 90087]
MRRGARAEAQDGDRHPAAWATWAMVAAIAVIAVLPLAIGAGDSREEPFAGADAQGQQAVEDIDPAYEPWFSPIVELPSSEVESGLFALQAAIGAGIIGYYFGVVRTRSRMRTEQAQATGGPTDSTRAGDAAGDAVADASGAPRGAEVPDGSEPTRG